MKSGMKKLLLVLGLLFFSVSFGLVKAQETPEEIYRDQLVEYLQAERDFVIAKGQYNQFGTLASIEKAALEVKEVMTSRAQVLETYFLLLKIDLKEAQGIELAYKDKTIERIEAAEGWLKAHKDEISKTSDRLELNDISDEFTQQSETLQLIGEHATTLLTVGKLQNTFDKINAIQAEAFSEAESTGNKDFSREKRELERVLTETETQLKIIWEEMRAGIDDFRSLGISSNLIKDLTPTYANLRKVLGFVFEVAGI